MTRRQITSSFKIINNAFKNSSIDETIIEILRGRTSDKVDFNITLANSLKEYSILASKFTQNEIDVLSIFNLRELDSPKIWQILLNQKNETSNRAIELRKIYSGINNFKNFLPQVLELFKQEDLNYFVLPIEERPTSYQDKEILTIILHEGKNQISNPERLVEALEAIKLIYSTCAYINDENPNELSVLAIDSGSDKSFDFLGAAKIIECTKDFIFSLWDRVVFHREKKMKERLDLIAQSLPIIEKIAEAGFKQDKSKVTQGIQNNYRQIVRETLG